MILKNIINVCPGPQELCDSKHVDMNPTRKICIIYITSSPLLCGCLRYTRYCICDTDPPCRVHAHMFTIIQFLRARANIHTVLEG